MRTRRLFGTLRRQRGPLALSSALGLAGVVLSVLGPITLGRATDLVFAGAVGRTLPAGESKQEAVERLRATGQDTLADLVAGMDVVPGQHIDAGAVGRVLLVALLLYGGAALAAVLQGRTAASAVQRAMFELRERCAAKLARLPLARIEGGRRGELLSRVTNDVDNIGQSLQQTLGQLVTSVLTVIGVLAMMIVISPVLALVALVGVPLSAAAATLIAKRARPQFAAQWAATGRLNAHVEDMYSGHDLVTAFGRGRESLAAFREHNDALCAATFRAQVLAGVIMPVLMFVGNLGYVLIAVAGALMVTSGTLTLGAVQAFVQYSRLFIQPVTQLATMAGTLQSGLASADRVFELLDEPEQEPDRPTAELPAVVRGRVEFDRVVFRHRPGRPAVDGVSFTAEPGELVAIVGATGAGKTTLAGLLPRLHEADAGRILLDGVDIATVPRDRLRAVIGLVPQEPWLMGGTVADNIAYGRPEATRAEIVAAARAAHADRLIRTLPDGYDTVLGEDADTLSTGEKQLITIARAFLVRPAVLVMDEATSALDDGTEALVQRAMRDLRAGRTSLVIAHRLTTVRDADLILVMDEGAIVERGRHADLLRADGVYAALWAARPDEPAPSADPGAEPLAARPR